MIRNVVLIAALGFFVLMIFRGRSPGYDNPADPYRISLERLADFQTQYRLDHGSYSNAPGVEGYEAAERYISVAGRAEEGSGWGALARRRGVPDWGCVYVTGSYSEPLETPGGKAAKPFEVVCDDGPPPGSPLKRQEGG